MNPGYEWIVLIEAAAETVDDPLGAAAMERFLAEFEEYSPVGLYCADRYAVQLLVAADAAEAALASAFCRWRHAVAEVGLKKFRLVRAEIKTLAELETELAPPTTGEAPIGMVPADASALKAAYMATRSLLRMRSPSEAPAILSLLTHRLGGTVVPAAQADPNALAVDLSFDALEPIHPSAEPVSVARLHLEEVLPLAVDDAWHAISLLRRGQPVAADGSSME